jgi:flagellar basal-body rod modification protein FlgD
MSTSTNAVTNSTTGLPEISSSLNSGTGAAAASSTTKDQFMKLFIAQLQHQDPLAPQDSTAFLAQLAQMSQLEQTTETNSKLQSLTDAQAAANRASLSQMVGRKVTASADSIEVRDGSAPLGATGPTLGAHIDVAAKSLSLDVKDAAGKTIKTIDLGAHGAGDINIDSAALGSLPAGNLTFVVKGKGLDGSDISGKTSITGTIDAMQIVDSGGSFRMGPFNVSPANITSVGAVAP